MGEDFFNEFWRSLAFCCVLALAGRTAEPGNESRALSGREGQLVVKDSKVLHGDKLRSSLPEEQPATTWTS